MRIHVKTLTRSVRGCGAAGWLLATSTTVAGRWFNFLNGHSTACRKLPGFLINVFDDGKAHSIDIRIMYKVPKCIMYII